MSKKLKFYGLCLTVVYVIFFGHNVYEFAKYGVGGYNFGNKEVEKLGNYHVLVSSVVPVGGSVTFPTTVINEKTGEEVCVEIRELMAFIFDSPDTMPTYVKLMDLSIHVFAFGVFLLFLIIPFLVYRVMKSISKNEFYSLKNIRRIKKLSYILLAIYAVTLLESYLRVLIANAYLQIKDYTACLSDFNYALLFMGLVVLIMSEILRYTTSIKEEQELTI